MPHKTLHMSMSALVDHARTTCDHDCAAVAALILLRLGHSPSGRLGLLVLCCRIRLAVAAVQQAEAAAAPPPQACPIKQHQRTPGGDREARTRAAPSECPAPWLTYLYASPRASSDAKNSRLPLARVISMLWAGQWRRGMQRS